jgi:mitochondrial chaperone BCS1
LQELISCLPERCIALMEDIDAAFRHDITREPTTTDSPHSGSSGANGGGPGVTLSGLLNAIDGVAAHEGRLLFATTNRYESLDPALRRPGRMDRHIEFKLASRYQITGMFQRFYGFTTSVPLPPCPEKPTNLHTDEKERKNEAEDWSPNSTAVSLVDFDSDASETAHSETSSEENQLKEWQAASLDDQARKFASLVPARLISMAELQGYLMLHRSDPVSALAGVRKFIREKGDRERFINPQVALKIE